MSFNQERTAFQRFCWSTASENQLIDLILIQCRRGKRASNGLKKEAWKAIQAKFNEERSPAVELLQLKTKYFVVRTILLR